MSNGAATLATFAHQRLARIVGYTYRANNLCPEDAYAKYANDWPAATKVPGQSYEEFFDLAAVVRGIDRDDETTFDSGDFPKVILLAHEPGCCDECGEPLEA